jgi:predicted nucleic acid-binding protein
MRGQRSNSCAVAESIIINTGPLITLARIDALDIVERLPYEFLCPQQVRDELDEGERVGYPRVAPPWLRVYALTAPLSAIALVGLDAGEAGVIQLALERRVPRICIDERKGRHVAQAVGLAVTETLGLLGRAKQLGLVSALHPWLEKATQEGIRYDPELVRRVLEAAGENR